MTNAKPSAGIFIMDKEAFKEKLKYGECDGIGDECTGIGTEMHTCPCAEDIYGDNSENCNCCSNCTYQCAMLDI